MSKKVPISKKLAKRDYKPAPRLIAWIYKTIMVDIIGRKYKPNFHIIDDVNDCDGPCFVIFNHLSRIDHMYVMGSCYPRITNMIAGRSEFYRDSVRKYEGSLPVPRNCSGSEQTFRPS